MGRQLIALYQIADTVTRSVTQTWELHGITRRQHRCSTVNNGDLSARNWSAAGRDGAEFAGTGLIRQPPPDPLFSAWAAASEQGFSHPPKSRPETATERCLTVTNVSVSRLCIPTPSLVFRFCLHPPFLVFHLASPIYLPVSLPPSLASRLSSPISVVVSGLPMTRRVVPPFSGSVSAL